MEIFFISMPLNVFFWFVYFYTKYHLIRRSFSLRPTKISFKKNGLQEKIHSWRYGHHVPAPLKYFHRIVTRDHLNTSKTCHYLNSQFSRACLNRQKYLLQLMLNQSRIWLSITVFFLLGFCHMSKIKLVCGKFMYAIDV